MTEHVRTAGDFVTPAPVADAAATARWAPLVAGLALLALVACAPVLGGFFHDDDFILLALARTGWSLRHPLAFVTVSQNGLFTPLNNVLFYLEFRAFGLRPLGYLVVAVLLHVLNTLLVTSLAWRVTRSRASAAAAGAVFAVGFAKMEAVSWIAANVHVVTTACYVASLNGFLLWTAGGRRSWYGLSVLAFALGTLSKEPIASLPLVILAASFLYGAGTARRRLWATVPFLALGAVYAAGMYLWQRHGPAAEFLQTGVYRPGWRDLGNYLALGGLPLPPDSMEIQSFLSRLPLLAHGYTVLSALCGLALTPLLLWAVGRGTRAVRFSALLTLVSFLPFAFVTVGIAPRYLYLPSVGFSLLVGSLAGGLAAQRPTPRQAWGRRLLVGYAIANVSFLFVWQVQQNRNGQVRRDVIRAVAARAPWPPGATVSLSGLPPKFQDVDMALPLWVRGAPHLRLTETCPPGGTGAQFCGTLVDGRLAVRN